MATEKEFQPSDEEVADQPLAQPGKHQGKGPHAPILVDIPNRVSQMVSIDLL